MNNLNFANFLISVLIIHEIRASDNPNDLSIHASSVSTRDSNNSCSPHNPVLESMSTFSNGTNIEHNKASCSSKQRVSGPINSSINTRLTDSYFLMKKEYSEWPGIYRDAVINVLNESYGPVDFERLEMNIMRFYKDFLIKSSTEIFSTGVVKNSKDLILYIFQNQAFCYLIKYVGGSREDDDYHQLSMLSRDSLNTIINTSHEEYKTMKHNIEEYPIFKMVERFMFINEQALEFLNQKKRFAPDNSPSKKTLHFSFIDADPDEFTVNQIRSMIKKIESINFNNRSKKTYNLSIDEYSEALMFMLFAYFAKIENTFNISDPVKIHLAFINYVFRNTIGNLNMLAKDLMKISTDMDNLVLGVEPRVV